MSRFTQVAALLLATWAADVAAQDGTVFLMQRSSEPGEAKELFVFVGEYVSYKPLDMGCDDCIVFDSWHTARYRVAEWIHGVPPGPEIEFAVAEHATNVPFGHAQYSLVFIERYDDKFALVKYQQVPVYPTSDGSFASCGPMWGHSSGPAEPLDPAEPALRDVDFSPRRVVDDARRLSPLGRAQAYDPRWHEALGDEVVCRRGIPVAELVPAIVRDHDTLKAALPNLARSAR